MEISKDTIGNYVKEWVSDKIGVDFKFRQYQKRCYVVVEVVS